MRFIFLCLFSLYALFAQAQPVASGLIAHYNFDNAECKPFDATGNGANQGVSITDNAICGCGVLGNAMIFDGIDDGFVVAGNAVTSLFEIDDFTLSFYFKSIPAGDNPGGNQILFSKKQNLCDFDRAFEVSYSPNSRFLTVLMQDDSDNSVTVNSFVDQLSCWQWVTIIRRGVTTLLYINGELKEQIDASERVNITNDNALVIGQAQCDLFDSDFEGLMEDIRFYNRALQRSEIETLNYYPDRIANSSFSRDTLIFKGSSVPIYLAGNCAESFSWEPADQVCDGCTDVTEPTPDLFPQTTTTFTVTMQDSLGCLSRDTLRVTVIDPDTLDCTTAFLPKAFTPNFDGLNDTYGIDNPLVIDELISFEIFDKWGERIFYTTNALERWDGAFLGKEMNAGVYLYRVAYRCEEEEFNKTDSFSVIR